MKDFFVVPENHTFLMNAAEVAAQTAGAACGQ
jgi:hypothetical protein